MPVSASFRGVQGGPSFAAHFGYWVLSYVPEPPALNLISQVAINRFRFVGNKADQVQGPQDPGHGLLLREINCLMNGGLYSDPEVKSQREWLQQQLY